MQNAQSNPTQSQQNEMAAKSPAKTPATGGAGPDVKTQAREFSAPAKAQTGQTIAGKQPAPLPIVQPGAGAEASGDPVRRAAQRIVSVDVANSGASDSSIDTDGKGLEAAREASGWTDNVVTSEATGDNAIATPDEGLGGFDSRVGGNLPGIAARPGWRVRSHGAVYVERLNGGRAELLISFEETSETH
ncbi:DUF3005 domain-containing protein [Paraburkholderia phosphatilytica]|uniref:DUF3005 domain-containing protein n=1 Tax=Paraburkholderia phosphatilytica TaxID=2282883 RepID=UPI000E509FC1|nr:DUF3005 domain-containing protein [Paraburkholderia phosphatilytica]